MPLNNLSEAEKIIGYTFKDKELLKKCFTHSSFANENGIESNERLEFLGDKVLDLAIAEDLFNKNKNNTAGFLTAEKQEIVSKKPLAQTVKKLGLQKFLSLSKGESIEELSIKSYSDIFEALIAGIYIDGGFEKAKKFILDNITKTSFEASSISDFQEFVQKYKLGEFVYRDKEKIGKDHNPEFIVELVLDGKIIAQGRGRNKQSAKAAAAKIGLVKLKSSNN
jgi:ribonuclease-3